MSVERLTVSIGSELALAVRAAAEADEQNLRHLLQTLDAPVRIVAV